MIERLIEALDDYQDARKELDECTESAGYEAGHFCHYQRKRKEKAADRLAAELDALIDARVKAIVAGGTTTRNSRDEEA